MCTLVARYVPGRPFCFYLVKFILNRYIYVAVESGYLSFVFGPVKGGSLKG